MSASRDRSSEGNRFLEAVRNHALSNPQAIAYQVDGASDVSYGQLWELAGRIAQELAVAAPGRMPVLVYGEKSALTVAAFLGCLRSGHAFVSVDRELPAARVRDIAAQIEGATFLACVDVPADLVSQLSGCVVLDARGAVSKDVPAPGPAPERWVGGEDTNYVIFTSGSTGRPKGIEVSASNVAHFMDWMQGFPVVSEGGRVFLDQAHYSFDLSEYELVGALSTGGCLHALSREVSEDHHSLFRDLAGSGVEVWVSTPSFADFCLADPSFTEELLPQLRLFLFCGEELRPATARRLRERFGRARIANSYGPTESTVAVTYVEIDDGMLSAGTPLSVGRARLGTELRIVDRDSGGYCAPGVSGEIVIVGDTVAKGYYRNDEKTAAAFFEDRMRDGAVCRAYRTGDRGHIGADGMLYCEGRFDSYIKLNGFRMELGEIEGALEKDPLVSRAVVLPLERDGRVHSLRAYVVPERGQDLTGMDLVKELKLHLSLRVPSYMVPRSFRLLESLPLTPNEKVDHKALRGL